MEKQTGNSLCSVASRQSTSIRIADSLDFYGVMAKDPDSPCSGHSLILSFLQSGMSDGGWRTSFPGSLFYKGYADDSHLLCLIASSGEDAMEHRTSSQINI